MGDHLRGQKKDVFKFSIDIHSDGILTFHSDGCPDMKLTQKSVAASTAPSGNYEGSMPFTIDSAADFKNPSACDFGIDVKVAHQDSKRPKEPVALSDTAVAFLKITNAGDCIGVNLRDQKEGVSKYSLDIPMAF